MSEAPVPDIPTTATVVTPPAIEREASQARIQAIGELTLVFMKTPQFRRAPLARIESLIKPALATGQFALARATPEGQKTPIPVALALWASVSDDIDRRLSESNATSLRLTADEWKSGDNPWLIAVAGEKRAIPALIKRLQETKFKGKSIKTLLVDKQGAPKIGSIGKAESAVAH